MHLGAKWLHMRTEWILEYVRGVGTHQHAGEHAKGKFHNTSYKKAMYEWERKWAQAKQIKR